MISKQHRFHGYNSLRFTLRKGRVTKTNYCNVKHVLTRHDNYRLSIVVSKKIDKRAVVRNRIRRRLYELFRQAFRGQIIKSDIVVIVFKKDLAFMSHVELSEIFQPVIKDLKTKYETK